MKTVPIGTRAERQETVEFETTLTSRLSTLPAVYATPAMIRLMEEACYFALQPFCEGDEINVGAHINVKHVAATGLGAKVRAEAVLESFDGRFYTMRVQAWAKNGETEIEIGSGTVARAVVSVGKFMKRLKAQGARL